MPNEILTIGINGWGPVGRNAFYAALQDPQLSVVAVNDASFSAACIAYMMEHECPPHLPRVRVEAVNEKLLAINGTHRVHLTQETRPTHWGELGAQVVLECTGTNTTRERCCSHITFGATCVVIAAHSADAPLTGVAAASSSDSSAMQVWSCGSRVGALLAPLLRHLDDSFGLEDVSYTVLSGLSDEADPAAGRSSNPLEWRQVRLQQSTATGKGAFAPSATHTGTATLLKLLPALQGRLSASAFQVPGHKGCAVDLVVRISTAVTKEELGRVLATSPDAAADAAAQPFVKVVPAGSGAMISTDCLGTDCLLYEPSVSMTASGGHTHKLMLWVDLEWAYAKLVVEQAKALAGSRSPAASKNTSINGI